jgi:hypothetical protein
MLVDGALLIDNSFLEGLQACPRKLFYSQITRRVADTPRAALNAGACVHRVLKYRYRFCGPNPTEQQVQVMHRIIAGHMRVSPQPEDDYRNAGFLQRFIDAYCEQYAGDEWVPLATNKGPFVEMPFAFPLVTIDGLPVIYTGRIDLAIRLRGDIWVPDHKTTSMMGKTFEDEQALSAQQRGYCWAVKQATGETPRGYIINGLRLRAPTKTRAEVLDEDFVRVSFTIDQASLDEWLVNAVELIGEFLHWCRREHFPMKTLWCCGKYGRCEYFDVCTLPIPQRPLMLASSLYKENKWSPLNPTGI